MNLKRQISWLFASAYSSLTVRIEVCSYELHICSVNKETRVRYWTTLTVKLFHRYRIGTSNCYITVGSTKVFGNPPPNLYYSCQYTASNLFKILFCSRQIARHFGARDVSRSCVVTDRGQVGGSWGSLEEVGHDGQLNIHFPASSLQVSQLPNQLQVLVPLH